MPENSPQVTARTTESEAWTPSQVEAFLVEATWTLRRLPDKEKAWLYGSSVMWPAHAVQGIDGYGRDLSPFMQRLKTSPAPRQIDRYQKILDWLQMLPDTTDRRVVFWACWHLNGEARTSERDPLPWGRVRNSMGVGDGQRGYSRWALKRRHAGSLVLIAAVLTKREDELK